jgi:hypothetical protein
LLMNANDREILRTLEERVNGRLQSSYGSIMGCPRRRNGMKLGIFRDVNVPLFVFQGGLLGIHCPVRTYTDCMKRKGRTTFLECKGRNN